VLLIGKPNVEQTISVLYLLLTLLLVPFFSLLPLRPLDNLASQTDNQNHVQ